MKKEYESSMDRNWRSFIGDDKASAAASKATASKHAHAKGKERLDARKIGPRDPRLWNIGAK